jgi:chemotaxis protein histidine kinase CheA
MNDHNLDDLIIDNIDPKTTKTKSFLTIIALAIVVLIVAIILTKIVLKDPNEALVLEENDTEMISPELTLQNSISPQKETNHQAAKQENLALETPKPSPAVEPATHETATNNTVQTDTPSQQEQLRAQREAEKARIRLEQEKIAAQKALEEKLNQERIAAQKEAALAQQREEALKARQARLEREAAARKAAQAAAKETYYIQVGSFTQTPSKQFLSIIKKSGFDYTITAPGASGAKKLLIGPYSTRQQVDAALVRVRDRINKSAFVVKK